MTTAGTVVKGRTFLRGMKVRIKELAQEAKFIRLEETKIKNSKLYCSDIDTLSPEIRTVRYYMTVDLRDLRSHRIHEVRWAARAAQLSYAFLREVPYSKVESKRKPEKEWYFNHKIKPEIVRLSMKFGNISGRFPQKETWEKLIEEWLTT